jgi:hypothetical protein
MNVCLGFKAHSGWAALVALGRDKDDLHVIDRRRIELADPADGEWAKQPYHAAEGLPSARAKAIVERGIATARTMAVKEITGAITRAKEAGHAVIGCGVLVGTPMPKWSVDEILAVHFRMHQAEGVLYRDVLIDAARACKLRVVEAPAKHIGAEAERVLKRAAGKLNEQVAALKAQVGAPWGKDQKDAALAAMIGLVSGIRHPASGIRHPASGIRQPATGNRQPKAESRKPKAES